jgi:hypothetical protein
MSKNKVPEQVNILRMRQYNTGYKSADAEMVVGGHYWLNRRYVRFIRVTPKGFNFLDEETSRCIFKHHFTLLVILVFLCHSTRKISLFEFLLTLNCLRFLMPYSVLETSRIKKNKNRRRILKRSWTAKMY